MNMDVFLDLLLIAVLIEAMLEVVKGALIKWEWVTIALGAVICPLAGLDAFALLNLPLTVPGVPWLGGLIGAALTGVIASRGAYYLHDVWSRVRGVTDE